MFISDDCPENPAIGRLLEDLTRYGVYSIVLVSVHVTSHGFSYDPRSTSWATLGGASRSVP